MFFSARITFKRFKFLFPICYTISVAKLQKKILLYFQFGNYFMIIVIFYRFSSSNVPLTINFHYIESCQAQCTGMIYRRGIWLLTCRSGLLFLSAYRQASWTASLNPYTTSLFLSLLSCFTHLPLHNVKGETMPFYSAIFCVPIPMGNMVQTPILDEKP